MSRFPAVVTAVWCALAGNFACAADREFSPISIEPYSNQKLTENFHGSTYPGNSLSELPRGDQTLAGVQFHIEDAAMQVTGKFLPRHPLRIDGIEVGRTFEKLHILQSAGWGAFGQPGDATGHFVADGVPIGYYELHYEDNSVAAIPIVYGVDVRDWWSVWDNYKPCPRSQVAWKGNNAHLRMRAEAANAEFPLRLFLTTWENPKPDLKVNSIDFISLNQTAAPFCIALTAEGSADRLDGAVAWSPDGKWIASAQQDGTIRLWTGSGAPGPALTGHSGPVNAVAWSPDSKAVVSAGRDGTIRLWKLDGERAQVIEGHNSPVNCVAISPDGQLIAAGDENRTARIWKLDGSAGPVLEGHYGAVSSVCWSPDGKHLAAASQGFVPLKGNGRPLVTLRVWGADGTPGAVIEGHEKAITSVAWSPDGESIASASRDGSVRFWDINGRPKPGSAGRSPVRPAAPVLAVRFGPQDGEYATAGRDSIIRIWAPNGREHKALKGEFPAVNSISWNPDGKQLVSVHSDGTLRVWNIDKGTSVQLQEPAAAARRLREIAAEIQKLRAEAEALNQSSPK